MFSFLDEDEEEQKQDKPVTTAQDTPLFNFLDEDTAGTAPTVKKDVPVTQEAPMFDDIDLPVPEINSVPLPSPDDDDEEIDINVTAPPEAQEDKEDDFDYEAVINQLAEEDLERQLESVGSDWYEYNDKAQQEKFKKQKAYIQTMADEKGISFEDEVNSNPDKYKQYIQTTEFMERNPDMLPSDLTAAEYRQQIRQRVENKKSNILARLNSQNAISRKLTKELLKQGLTISEVNAAVTADEFLNPATAALNVPIAFADSAEHIRNGEYGSAIVDGGIGVLEAIPGLTVGSKALKGVNKTWKSISGGKSAYNDIQNAMMLENQIADGIKARNAAKAAENKELRTQLILEFQERNNVDIAKELKDGNLDIDTTKVREQGQTKITDYYHDDVYQGTEGKTAATPLDDMSVGDHELAIPYLNPEKMDALVGVVADLQAQFPDAFPTKTVGKGKNRRTVGKQPLIDQLFDLTVMKPTDVNKAYGEGMLKAAEGETFFESSMLFDILNKHGMSYEEYTLGVVSSGSQAGRIMNRLSQMRRVKPRSVQEIQAERARKATESALSKFWSNTVLRGENIRRGLLVSSFATAMRNAQSVLVRAPMESMANVMDTALLTYARAVREGDTKGKALGKFTRSINPLVRDGTYKNSYRNMTYLFARQAEAEEFTQYILDRPELADQLTKMLSNINELQEATGRGQAVTKVGKGLDAAASRVEDFVNYLNTPNRWQEHITRRATFMSELERITAAEWGIDLKDVLKQGRIQDVLNDAEDLRGAKGRSFVDIVEEATDKALDVTYAKQPDFFVFKNISNFITKSGLTAVIPFPRFMFNAFDYMAQNAAGAGLVAMRKAISKESRQAGLTVRDRQDITRNLVGLGAISAFYQYRASDDAPAKYEDVAYEDKQINTTATFPLRQMGWIAEFARRGGLKKFGFDGEEDTVDTWYGMDMKHLAEVWIGTTARTGMGNIFVEEMVDIVANTSDEIDEQKRAQKIGAALGQYAATYFTPYFQIVDAQRAMGIRRDNYGDAAMDPSFKESASEAAKAGFMRSFIQRGFAAPSYENELPARVDIVTGDARRFDPFTKLAFGLSIRERDSDMAEYLATIGYDDPTYQLGSKSRIPSQRRAENAYISMALPLLVEGAEYYADALATTKKDKIDVARKFLDDTIAAAKGDFDEKGFSAPEAKLVDKLSQTKKVDRKYAFFMFKQVNGRPPDLTEVQDLQQLIEFSKDVKID